MDRSQWKRWEKIRKNGKWYFALVLGGLVLGPVAGLIISLFVSFSFPDLAWQPLALVMVPFSILIGILLNLRRWDQLELRFLSENPPMPTRHPHSRSN